MDEKNRVVVLIDMDCFYCQVEEKLNPELKGKPIAVVQYNPWKGGGIIAVNYVARAMGVTRHMRGDEAKEKCPEIHLPSVPCQRGKADITKYREAGIEVAKVLQKFTPLLERASIDEAYLDITQTVKDRLSSLQVASITPDMIPNTFALGYDSVAALAADVRAGRAESLDYDPENCELLLAAAVVVSEIRAAVYHETGYRCSAGVAHNKILAKLVCGMNKPDKQTLLPKHTLPMLYESLPVSKVKHLGGKFGAAVSAALGARVMADLLRHSERELQDKFDEKNGTWLYNIARGVDLEPVTARFNPKSIGCCKQFKGKNALLDLESLRKWLKDLGDEIEDRLEKDALENERTPRQMVVSFATQLASGRDSTSSRSYNFSQDDEVCADLFYAKALELILDSMEAVKPKANESNRKLRMPVKFLGISVGKFEDHSETKKTKRILDYFAAGSSKETSNKENSKIIKNDVKEKKNKGDKEFVLQKYFQSTKVKVDNSVVNSEDDKDNLENETKDTHAQSADKVQPVLESSLDRQESFFAKLLNSKTKPDEIPPEIVPPEGGAGGGDDSNDTDYSSSTINNEINQSISLFEDSPQDVVRITNIRNLMKTGTVDETDDDTEVKNQDSKTPSPQLLESIKCTECNKIIPTCMIETHADYHLALKLREEERQQARQERERTVNKVEVKVKTVKESVKCEANSSIANFLVKLDDTATETCSECGRKVGLEKFAEHLDFHEAQRLSREINNRPAPRAIAAPRNINSSHLPRKRKAASPAKKLDKRCRPIDSFFR